MSTQLKSLFPNLSTVAYYDTFGQQIFLSEISRSEFDMMLNDIVNRKRNQDAEIFLHELQHWLDHHTTLWGLKNILDIFNSYNIRLQPELIDKFSQIPSLIREVEKQFSQTYYFEKYNDIIPSRLEDKWHMSYSMGYRFDFNGRIDMQKPILFVRFLSKEQVPVCRTPVSLASLLETNAITSEIDIQIHFLGSLKGQTLKDQSEDLYKAYFKWLYNPNMTLYSVAAHLTSNILHEPDIFTAFQLSRKVSTLSLNIPQILYDRIPTPKYFQEFGDRNEKMKSNRDIGYLYTCLLLNYSEKYSKNHSFNVDDILTCSNLPTSKELQVIIIEELNKLYDELVEGPFTSKAKKARESFIKLISERGISNETLLDYHFLTTKGIIPYLIFSNSLIGILNYKLEDIFIKMGKDIQLSVGEWQTIVNYSYSKLYEFYKICGI